MPYTRTCEVCWKTREVKTLAASRATRCLAHKQDRHTLIEVCAFCGQHYALKGKAASKRLYAAKRGARPVCSPHCRAMLSWQIRRRQKETT